MEKLARWTNANLRWLHSLFLTVLNTDRSGSIPAGNLAGPNLMRILLVSPQTPETFWSFKHVLRFVFKRAAFPPLGLLPAVPQTRLYQRLKREGRLVTQSSGNNTQAELYFQPKLNREFLQSGYRDLMKKLYEPGIYYRRVRTFLRQHRATGFQPPHSRADLRAFAKPFWLLGVWYRGRVAYWKLFWSTLLRRPRHFRRAIEFAIIGYHFRRVAKQL